MALLAVERAYATLGNLQRKRNYDERVAAVAGEARTLGVIMTISAAVYEPGIALRIPIA